MIKLIYRILALLSFSNQLNKILFKFKVRLYNYRIPKILSNLKDKEKINVVFFVANISMWKSDYLFKIFLGDNRFNPVIVPFLYPRQNLELQREIQNDIISYFKDKGYPAIEIRDFENYTLLDINCLKPDIIFYPQPYNSGYNRYKLENFCYNALMIYIPYCFEIEKHSIFHNLLLYNVAWKLYFPTQAHKDLELQSKYDKRDNIVVSAYTMFEYFKENNSNNRNIWKSNNRKRIIWAPHHSILPNDILNYSTFLDVADKMLILAKEYSDKIEFVFKPHPMLKEKLYTLQDWGIIRTDNYYNEWKNGINSSYISGDYIDLFMTSDALIHDCSTFSVEYLYTRKPCFYLSKSDHETLLTDFGKECYHLHYIGDDIESIKYFIDHVLLEDNDYMLDKRLKFINKHLITDSSPSKIIYDDIINSL